MEKIIILHFAWLVESDMDEQTFSLQGGIYSIET